jgi:hypothetical protein
MYCNKVGHRESQWFSKMSDQRYAATTALASGSTPTPTTSTNQTDNFGLLMVIESCHAVAFLASSYANKDLCIANTGASCHMTCNDTGMFNCIDINEDIKVLETTLKLLKWAVNVSQSYSPTMSSNFLSSMP